LFSYAVLNPDRNHSALLGAFCRVFISASTFILTLDILAQGNCVYYFLAVMASTSDSLPFVPLEPYNGTVPTGGDSEALDLNVFYQAGDISWMITSTALVLLMIPGVG
jgi:hypothetical protein